MSQENFKNKMILDAEVAKVVSEYAVEQAKYKLRMKVTEAVKKLGLNKNSECKRNSETKSSSSTQQSLSADDVLKPLLKEAVQDLEKESILTLLQTMSPESVNELRVTDTEGVDLPILSYVAKHTPAGGLSDSALCEYVLNYHTGHTKHNQLVDLTLPDSRGHTIFYYLKDKEGEERNIATMIAYCCKTIGTLQLQEPGKDKNIDEAERKNHQKVFDEEYALMNISSEYGATNLAAAVQDIISAKNSQKGDEVTQSHGGLESLSDSEEFDIAQALQGLDEK